MSGGFPAAAKVALRDSQLRRNVGKATTTIRAKRGRAVAELDDWEQLRTAGAAISARLRWIAGTRMCDCSSSPSCTISSARSVSIAAIPRCSSASLRPISSVAIDLTLITSRAP